MPSYRGSVWYIRCIKYSTIVIETEQELTITKDTPDLNFRGELWGVFWKDFRANWLRYKAYFTYIFVISYNISATQAEWKPCLLS